MTVDPIPAVTAGRPATAGQRLAELHELARAEQAMADGCPTPEQELLLMSVGSQAHRARRHHSIAGPRRAGLVTRLLRRVRGAR
jgi:hypothetical protein